MDGRAGYIYKDDIDLEALTGEPAPTPSTDNKKVTIFSSRRKVMKLGEAVNLTSKLEGFEDCTEISYQWECDKGSGFAPVSGATGDSYTFSADVESLSWDWRLVISYR